MGGKAILDWLVDDIDMAGCVEEYIVISNHKYAAHFAAWARGKPQRIAIIDDGTVKMCIRDRSFTVAYHWISITNVQDRWEAEKH